MPGDGLTHGPPATKKAGGSHHRSSQINRHSLRDGLRLIRDLPGVHDLLVTVACDSRRVGPEGPTSPIRKLGASPGAPGPRDFAVRIRHARLTCRPRPSHPRPTCRDDRPKRPSSSRRDARDDGCDLPDNTSVNACGRLARRAIRAWVACGNCVSGMRVRNVLRKPHPSVRQQFQ
jgi:hypothetical protein